MESNTFTERLTEFGLTRQEAAIYECLLTEGKTTGYEVAKQIGISRSNAYGSLASMTEKGAAYLVEEGSTRKYVPVPLEEFCRNCIRRLESSRQWLLLHKPSEKPHVEGYITIEGAENVLNKRMRDEVKVTVNEFLEEIGLDPCDESIGENLGWDIDKGWIDLDFSSQLVDGVPYLVVGHHNPPRYIGWG